MRTFTRPLPLLATLLLVVNDHALKGAALLPTWLTGKLSDVAGLFLFPILLVGLATQLLGARGRTTRTAALAVGVTGLAFGAVKLSPAACDWLSAHFATTTYDPTDLAALPSLALAYVYMIRTSRRSSGAGSGATAPSPRSQHLERVGLVVAAAASLATSPFPRPFAAWNVVGSETRVAGCARVDAWVAKSGKEGVGIAIAARGPVGCTVRLDRATLLVGEKAIAASPLPTEVRAERAAYLPFLFDNEKAWNDGERAGSLEIAIVADGEPVVLRFVMQHAWTHATFSGASAPKRAPLFLAVDPPDAGAAFDAPDAGPDEDR